MEKHYLFPVFDWRGKYYTSAVNLHEAALKGLIEVKREETKFGAWYTFTTKEGVFVANIYKDTTFGFCSQAYGVQVPPPYEMFPDYKKYLDDRWNERQLSLAE